MAKKSKNQLSPGRTGAATPVATPSPVNAGPMDPVLLERLVQLMSANDISALDLRDGHQRVSLKRGPQHVAYAPPAAATQYQAAHPQYAAAHLTGGSTADASPAGPTKPQAADADADLKPIKSPMVGTFYSAASPDAKAFVQVGSTVNEETDICVIEAMKVFNNIKAEMRGTIAKICVENGKTVEFGTVLFLVKQ